MTSPTQSPRVPSFSTRLPSFGKITLSPRRWPRPRSVLTNRPLAACHWSNRRATVGAWAAATPASRLARFAAVGSTPWLMCPMTIRACRRAAANPSFGNLPSVGRTRRPSGNRALTVHVKIAARSPAEPAPEPWRRAARCAPWRRIERVQHCLIDLDLHRCIPRDPAPGSHRGSQKS